MLMFDGELQIFKYYPKFVDDGIWVSIFLKFGNDGDDNQL